MHDIGITRTGSIPAAIHPWGELLWLADGARGNGQGMTVGRCTINPGCRNPVHRHAGHGEVLVVLSGRIRHTGPGGSMAELFPGDVVSIPDGIPHQAVNAGADAAVLLVAYPVPIRDVRGE